MQEKEGIPSANDSRKCKLDFLDIILTAKDNEGNSLTDLEIRNEVDTFLFEGKIMFYLSWLVNVKKVPLHLCLIFCY